MSWQTSVILRNSHSIVYWCMYVLTDRFHVCLVGLKSVCHQIRPFIYDCIFYVCDVWLRRDKYHPLWFSFKVTLCTVHIDRLASSVFGWSSSVYANMPLSDESSYFDEWFLSRFSYTRSIIFHISILHKYSSTGAQWSMKERRLILNKFSFRVIELVYWSVCWLYELKFENAVYVKLFTDWCIGVEFM